MIMPTRVIQPVDSLISISSCIIDILKKSDLALDDLLVELNSRYYKSIQIDTLILCIDFLFIIGKIKDDNEIITINI